jgi:hypothetical protein
LGNVDTSTWKRVELIAGSVAVPPDFTLDPGAPYEPDFWTASDVALTIFERPFEDDASSYWMDWTDPQDHWLVCSTMVGPARINVATRRYAPDAQIEARAAVPIGNGRHFLLEGSLPRDEDSVTFLAIVRSFRRE